jgi:hypothetical protein
MRHDLYSLACLILAGMIEAVQECDDCELEERKDRLKNDGLILHRNLGYKEIEEQQWGEWVNDRCPESSFLTK